MSVKHIALASIGLLVLPALSGAATAQQPPAFQLQGAPSAIGTIPAPLDTGDQAKVAPQAQVAMPTRLPVSNNLLKTVMEKQEQMLLLDLEIKKALMEKQLREAHGELLGKDSFGEVDSLLKTPLPTPTINIDDVSDSGDEEPTLMRISKQDDELVAMIKTPDGGVMLASKGATLPGGWKVTAITSSSVMASQGGKSPVALKFASKSTSSGGFSGSIGGGSLGSSIIRQSGSIGMR